MAEISIMEARNNFRDITNRVEYLKERLVLTRNNKEVAALVPMEDYRLLVKMIEMREDSIDSAIAEQALKRAEVEGTDKFSGF